MSKLQLGESLSSLATPRESISPIDEVDLTEENLDKREAQNLEEAQKPLEENLDQGIYSTEDPLVLEKMDLDQEEPNIEVL